MTEYVDRRKLLDDIGETVLFSVRGGADYPTPEIRGASKVINRICAAPAADVVEVVRCKDCKYWDTGYRFCKFHGLDSMGNSAFGENGYCSYGERKDDSNDQATQDL